MREIGHFIGGKQVRGKLRSQRRRVQPQYRRGAGQGRVRQQGGGRAAIANAEAAQPAWAATNPQRRARVLFRFLELVQKEFDNLARLLSSEHGKTACRLPAATSSAAWRWSSSPAAFPTC